MKLIDLDAKEPYLLDGRYSVGILDNASTVKRPQGEWITENLVKPYGKCNQCSQICEIDNYCGNCGAKMKKGGAKE